MCPTSMGWQGSIIFMHSPLSISIHFYHAHLLLVAAVISLIQDSSHSSFSPGVAFLSTLHYTCLTALPSLLVFSSPFSAHVQTSQLSPNTPVFLVSFLTLSIHTYSSNTSFPLHLTVSFSTSQFHVSAPYTIISITIPSHNSLFTFIPSLYHPANSQNTCSSYHLISYSIPPCYSTRSQNTSEICHFTPDIHNLYYNYVTVHNASISRVITHPCEVRYINLYNNILQSALPMFLTRMSFTSLTSPCSREILSISRDSVQCFICAANTCQSMNGDNQDKTILLIHILLSSLFTSQLINTQLCSTFL